MDRQDTFLYAYRKDPPPEAVEDLWRTLSSQETPRPRIGRIFSPRMAAVGLAAVIILVVFVLPTRVVAQDLLRLFVRAARDSFTIHFSFDGPAAPRVDFDGIDPPADVDVSVIAGSDPDRLRPAHVYPTLDATHSETDGPFHAPTYLPEDYRFLRGLVRPGSPVVSLVYGRENGGALTLHQTRLGPEPPAAYFASSLQMVEQADGRFDVDLEADYAFGAIGPDVRSEMVPIGAAAGEYVRGAWRIDDETFAPGGMEPGSIHSITPRWDSSSAGQMVRWTTDTMLFELIVTDDDLAPADLAEIAAGIEPYHPQGEEE